MAEDLNQKQFYGKYNIADRHQVVCGNKSNFSVS